VAGTLVVIACAGCSSGASQDPATHAQTIDRTPGTASNASASIASPRPPGGASVHVYRVLSGSMEPTLPIRTRVAVRGGAPVLGAIVVAHQPEGSAMKECGRTPHIIKLGGAACDASVPQESQLKVITRIVAGPGDEI
jgi:signal peptidase I